jgi:hypothetical protein
MGDDLESMMEHTKAVLGIAGSARPSAERRDQTSTGRTVSLPDDLSLTGPDGSDPRGSLTSKQRAVLERLILGEELEAAAIREGVHPERVRRWLGTVRFERARLLEMAQPKRRLPVGDQRALTLFYRIREGTKE